MKTPEEWMRHLIKDHGLGLGQPAVTDPVRFHNVLHHPATPKHWNNHTHEGMMVMSEEDVAYEDRT